MWSQKVCVNIDRYDLSKKSGWRKEVRDEYGISNNAVVFGYCGRITRDKGLNELFAAFKQVTENMPEGKDAYLMIIGRNDHAETINQELFTWAKSCPKVIFTGFTHNVPKYYSALDVFNTIEHMNTGYSVPGHDVEHVVEAMNFYVNDPGKAFEMGKNARKVVEEKYDQEELFRQLAAHRNQLIEEASKNN